MSKEGFKSFARIHPELANNVIEGKITWQKLYELYDIYGENSTIWEKYLIGNENIETKFSDIISTIKNIDMKTVQDGIENMQKAISLLQGIGLNSSKSIGAQNTSYEARPMYKYFED